MKHSLTKSKKINIQLNGKEVALTLLPLSYYKLIEINDALGEGKDLNHVLNNLEHLDIVIVVYNLLDDKSISKIEEIEILLNKQVIELSEAEKLFYLISNTNVHDGVKNFNSLITDLSKHVQESVRYTSKIQKKSLVKRIMAILRF